MLVRSHAYNIGPSVDLSSDDNVEKARLIVRRRLAQAGIRLAWLLSIALKQGKTHKVQTQTLNSLSQPRQRLRRCDSGKRLDRAGNIKSKHAARKELKKSIARRC
jgi:hypothetical protein